MGEKIKITSLLFYLLNISIAYSQCTNTCGANIVDNSGFELFTANCGTNDIQLYYSQSPVQNWFGVEDNTPLAGSTPDYFSPCAGVTNSANNNCINGTARIGLFTKTSFSNGREYVQTQLSTPLVAGKEYCFSMNVKSRVGAAGNVLSECDGIGAWFHDQGLINITTMNGGQQFLGPGSIVNAQPQVENPQGNMISSSCVTITGTFCATGNEQFLVIGNFRDDAATTITGFNPNNYMYIDDVDLFEICPIEIELETDNDSIPCGGTANLEVNTTASGLDFDWLPNNLGFVGPGPHSYSPNTMTTVSVIGSYVNSCGLTVSDTSSITIYVEPCIPTVEISDTTICVGECITLEPDTLYGGESPYTNFQWFDSSNTQIGSDLQSPQICPTSNTQYVFSFEDDSGIITYDTVSVFVNSFPIVNAGQDTSICIGEQLQLQGNYDLGTPEWPTLGSGSEFTVTPMTDEYFVFQSDNFGCVSYDSLLVEVNNLPLTDFISEDVSCFGMSDGSIQEIVNDNYIYDWGGGISGSLLSNLSAGVYPVSVTDTNGCIKHDTISINQPNLLEFNYNGSSTFCSSDTVKVVVDVTGGTPSYHINFGNGSIDSLIFIANTDTTVVVEITDENNCQIIDSIPISVQQKPTAEFSNLDTICENQDLFLENLSQNALNFEWFINDSFIGNNADLTLSNLGLGCHDITLLATSNNGCMDSVTKSCGVNVIKTPQSIVYSSPSNQIDIGGVITIFDNSQFGSSCVWMLGNQTISNNCNTSFPLEFNETGDYELLHIINNDFGCTDSSIIHIEVIDPITVYVPNAFTPDGDAFNNEFIPVINGQVDQDSYHLEIFNRWGEIIFESHNLNVGWNGTFNNSIAKDGVYIWVIKFKEQTTDKVYEYRGHLTLIK